MGPQPSIEHNSLNRKNELNLYSEGTKKIQRAVEVGNFLDKLPQNTGEKLTDNAMHLIRVKLELAAGGDEQLSERFQEAYASIRREDVKNELLFNLKNEGDDHREEIAEKAVNDIKKVVFNQ